MHTRVLRETDLFLQDGEKELRLFTDQLVEISELNSD